MGEEKDQVDQLYRCNTTHTHIHTHTHTRTSFSSRTFVHVRGSVTWYISTSSGLFYHFVVCDIDHLRDNITT